MDVKALALKYYPKYWSEKRITYLVKIGRLTPEDYKEITGNDYVGETPKN